jgi:iron-sulfur cluster assembly protein
VDFKTISMITFSENAVSGIHALRLKKSVSEEYCIRIGIQIGGCAGYAYYVGFDKQKENDEVFYQDDIIIIADKVHLQYFNGIFIDYIDQEYGGFKFHNPLAKRVCGCGTSFNTIDNLTDDSTCTQHQEQ